MPRRLPKGCRSGGIAQGLSTSPTLFQAQVRRYIAALNFVFIFILNLLRIQQLIFLFILLLVVRVL